jgi:hypothetical protein
MHGRAAGTLMLIGLKAKYGLAQTQATVLLPTLQGL